MTKKAMLMAIGVMVVLVWCVPPVLAADKVGFINLQRLVNESKMGKAARDDLLKLRKQKEDAVNKKGEDIKKLRDEINARGDKMSVQEKRDKLDVLQKAYKEYQRVVDDAREDIAREDKELVALILEKADPILKEVAKKNGFAVILKDPNAVGYLDPANDITTLVLTELNKK